MLILALLASLLMPCHSEDSTQCTWYASVQGNGIGSSFIAVNPDTIIYF